MLATAKLGRRSRCVRRKELLKMRSAGGYVQECFAEGNIINQTIIQGAIILEERGRCLCVSESNMAMCAAEVYALYSICMWVCVCVYNMCVCVICVYSTVYVRAEMVLCLCFASRPTQWLVAIRYTMEGVCTVHWGTKEYERTVLTPPPPISIAQWAARMSHCCNIHLFSTNTLSIRAVITLVYS